MMSRLAEFEAVARRIRATTAFDWIKAHVDTAHLIGKDNRADYAATMADSPRQERNELK